MIQLKLLASIIISINRVAQQIALEAKHFNAKECLLKEDNGDSAGTLIVEVNGSMIPIVDYQPSEPEETQSETLEAPELKRSNKVKSCF